jgi:hypothetical protein
MSMDPDGMNRIISQRIREWSAERDGDRNAALLEAERVGPRWPLVAAGRGRVVALAGRLLAVAVALPLAVVRAWHSRKVAV